MGVSTGSIKVRLEHARWSGIHVHLVELVDNAPSLHGRLISSPDDARLELEADGVHNPTVIRAEIGCQAIAVYRSGSANLFIQHILAVTPESSRLAILHHLLQPVLRRFRGRGQGPRVKREGTGRRAIGLTIHPIK